MYKAVITTTIECFKMLQRWTGNTPDFQAIQVIARTSEHKAALVSIKD